MRVMTPEPAMDPSRVPLDRGHAQRRQRAGRGVVPRGVVRGARPVGSLRRFASAGKGIDEASRLAGEGQTDDENI